MCRSVSRKRETGVWICSTKTVGSVILYEVTFAIPNIVSRDAIFEGTIWRRYSQFAALHELLQRVHIVDARLRREKLQPLPELPPKTLLPVVYAGDPQRYIFQNLWYVLMYARHSIATVDKYLWAQPHLLVKESDEQSHYVFSNAGHRQMVYFTTCILIESFESVSRMP